jgi:hypothetical protein
MQQKYQQQQGDGHVEGNGDVVDSEDGKVDASSEEVASRLPIEQLRMHVVRAFFKFERRQGCGTGTMGIPYQGEDEDALDLAWKGSARSVDHEVAARLFQMVQAALLNEHQPDQQVEDVEQEEDNVVIFVMQEAEA